MTGSRHREVTWINLAKVLQVVNGGTKLDALGQYTGLFLYGLWNDLSAQFFCSLFSSLKQNTGIFEVNGERRKYKMVKVFFFLRHISHFRFIILVVELPFRTILFLSSTGSWGKSFIFFWLNLCVYSRYLLNDWL